MPRRYEVDQHPQKKRIIKALIRGDSYREITERYGGLTKSALSRYLNEKLLPKTAEVAYQEGIRDGSLALKEVQEAMDRVHKMYRACDEYLAHPEKPGEYFLGPRAGEILIAYEEMIDGKWYKHTETLQSVLDRIAKTGRIPVRVRYKHADPRQLVLTTMSKAREQLEFLGKLSGQIQDIVVNVATNEQWAEIKIAIIEAVGDIPDARSRIVEVLKAIASS